MRSRLLVILFAISCGGSHKPAPAPTPAGGSGSASAASGSAGDSGMPPYMHPDNCKPGGTGTMCSLDECKAYGVAHGETADAADERCPQACNCGE